LEENAMKTLYRLAAALTFLGMGGIPLSAQDASPALVKPPLIRFGAGAGLLYWLFGGMTSGPVKVPLPLRQVPGHPDDFDHPPLITIPGETVQPSDTHYMMSYTIAPEIMIANRVAVRVGVEFDSPVDGEGPRRDSTGNTQEVNLQGTTERGFGRSLVYYAVSIEHPVSPHMYYEVEAKVRGPLWLLIGRKNARENYIIERGYDRYNSLKPFDTQTFALVKSKITYGGIHLRFFDDENRISGNVLIFGGVGTSSAENLLPVAPEMSFPGKGWFFGTRLSFSAFVK
jgi:hypothetical protein